VSSKVAPFLLKRLKNLLAVFCFSGAAVKIQDILFKL